MIVGALAVALVVTSATVIAKSLMGAEGDWTTHADPVAARLMEPTGPAGPSPTTVPLPPEAAVPLPPTTTSTLPTHASGRAPGVVPPSTFLLRTPVEAYPYVFERSVTLEGRFEFVYEQFGQPVLAFSPAPGTHTTWRLFTVMLYDRNGPALGGPAGNGPALGGPAGNGPASDGATRMEALLAGLRPGATTTVEVPVLRDPETERRFVDFATRHGDLSAEEARAKYERMLLSNREPLLGVGVGSYFVTSTSAVSVSPLT